MNRLVTFGIALSAVATLGMSSCDKAAPEKPGPGKELMLTAAEQEKALQNNLFAFELFRKATSRLQAGDNALLSPLSISAALAMTNNGAVGETRTAIEKTLKFEGMDAEAINTYYQKLIEDLPALDPRITLTMANSIWYRQGFQVLSAFLDANRTHYQADVSALDFADPGAPTVINDWVSNKTKKKIPTIIEGDIPDDMMLYLINAVYFKGAWEQRFDKSATQKGGFVLPGGASLQTDFMHLKHAFKVAETDEIEAIELPYGDRKYSMVVLKPKGDRTPAQLSALLTDGEAWETMVRRFQTRSTDLSFPKFTFSYENRLNDELTDMGMGMAFSDVADFSGISTEQTLTLSEVKHKSFVEVNEEGTEAAAVTSVGAFTTSAPTKPYVFTVDRPFLFVIREMGTGLILFIGQVNDPSVSTTMG